MKILAIDRVCADATPERIKAQFLKEINRCVQLYLADFVREMYFRQDRSGTVLVLEAPSLEEAQSLLQKMPLVAAGQVEYDCIPLGPYMPLGLLLSDESHTAPDTSLLENESGSTMQ